jgi:hypothetical protein
MKDESKPLPEAGLENPTCSINPAIIDLASSGDQAGAWSPV